MLKRFFVVLAVALAVVLVLCWIYLPAISRYRELNQEEERLEKRIREIDSQIKTLADEKYLLQNDLVYLEKVIREELGFVKPGEIIYEMVTQNKPGTPASSVVSTVSSAGQVQPSASLQPATEIKKAESKPSGTVSGTRKIRSPAGMTSVTKRRPSQN